MTMAVERNLFDAALYKERLAELHGDTLERSAVLRHSLAEHLKDGGPLTKWFPPFLIAAHSGDMVASDVAGAILDLLASRGTSRTSAKALIEEVSGIVALYRLREQQSLLRPNGKVVPLPDQPVSTPINEQPAAVVEPVKPLVEQPHPTRREVVLRWGLWVLATYGAIELARHIASLLS